jgi:hypothetical protein
MNSLTQKDQLVAYIKTIPEDHWLGRCNTPDRTRYLWSIRSYYLLVANLLEDFFHHREPEDIESKCQDKLLAKIAEQTAKEYRLIYALIFDAWKYIKADLVVIVQALINEQGKGNSSSFDLSKITPFHFACSIFCEDADRMLEDCIFPELATGNNYAEFGFAKNRRMVIEANKIIKNKTKLNSQQKKERERACKIFKERYFWMYLFLALLNKAALQDPAIKVDLHNFLKLYKQDLRDSPAQLHSDRVRHYPILSHTVRNGIIIPRKM